MALRVSRSFSVDQISVIPFLVTQLSFESQRTLRQMLFALPSPVDACSLISVIGAVSSSLSAYQDSVAIPHQSLIETVDRFKQLSLESQSVSSHPIDSEKLCYPLFRRYSTFPAWGVLIGIANEKPSQDIASSVGAELALSLLTGKTFNKSFASHLLNALQGKNTNDDNGIAVWQKKAIKIRREADAFFECGADKAPPYNSQSDQISFSAQVKHWFRGCVEFARDKDHQCVIDQRSQSKQQLIESARSIREQVEGGDDSAIQIMVAALTGIPVPLVLQTPFLSAHLDDWVLAIDLDERCIKMSIEVFADGRATPQPECEHSLVPAGDIISSPMPHFLCEALDRKFEAAISAKTLGDALPKASARPHTMTLELEINDRAGLTPSAARFISGIGKYGVEIGLDPYLVALLVHNPRLVPTGKFYYGQATRNELHATSLALYESLGWGTPAAIKEGLPVGSRVTPRASTISEWYTWMTEQVESTRPARRYNLKTLINFHCTYAKFAASVCSFTLALRDRKPIRLISANCIGQRNSIAVFDKPAGMIRGHRPVPLCPTIAAQIKYWFQHCYALDKRLERLGVSETHRCRLHIKKVLAGEEVPLFFSFTDSLAIHLLSTSDISTWWPESFGLEGNFGRHYWQTELRRAGVLSTEIDCYVRHSLRGNDPSSSTSSLVPRDLIAHLGNAVEQQLVRLQISAYAGLVAKV